MEPSMDDEAIARKPAVKFRCALTNAQSERTLERFPRV
jgi:hypothetical protein